MCLLLGDLDHLLVLLSQEVKLAGNEVNEDVYPRLQDLTLAT